MGRLLIVAGIVLVAAGLLVHYSGRLPFGLGRLPGDFSVQSKNVRFYFPLATSLLLSLLATLVFWLLNRR